ncbi:MAG: TRAP transporter large permease subunit, partial [Pseudomonadota bacterium]
MLETFTDILPGLMFLALVVCLVSGAPVAIMLMGVSLVFGLIAVALGEMRPVQATLIPNRIFGGTIENPVLVAAPMFIFMGLVMERTRIAEDLLITLQRLLRVVPGGLGLAVVLMGTILAAATGIIGASVVMLTVLALPTMVAKGYRPSLAAGTVASAGTLGILIPPSIMLVFMGDLLSVSIGRLFISALIPGLVLSALY